MKKSEEFEVQELGTSYELPLWRVVDGKGIEKIETNVKQSNEAKELFGLVPQYEYMQIQFVRGDKEDNGIIIPRVDGILHEQLLGMMIEDMKYKNSLVPSRESATAITKLQEALFWLEERQNQRTKAGTVGTYKK